MPGANQIIGSLRMGRRGRAGRASQRPEPGAGSAGPGAARRRLDLTTAQLGNGSAHPRQRSREIASLLVSSSVR